jgi:hypothetical protein
LLGEEVAAVDWCCGDVFDFVSAVGLIGGEDMGGDDTGDGDVLSSGGFSFRVIAAVGDDAAAAAAACGGLLAESANVDSTAVGGSDSAIFSLHQCVMT